MKNKKVKHNKKIKKYFDIGDDYILRRDEIGIKKKLI